jgi:hypothetical protein
MPTTTPGYSPSTTPTSSGIGGFGPPGAPDSGWRNERYNDSLRLLDRSLRQAVGGAWREELVRAACRVLLVFGALWLTGSAHTPLVRLTGGYALLEVLAAVGFRFELARQLSEFDRW